MSDLSRWIKQGLLVILVPGLAHPGWKLQTNSVAVTSLPDMWMCGGAVRRDANVHSTSQLHIHCAGGAAGLSSSEERVQCRAQKTKSLAQAALDQGASSATVADGAAGAVRVCAFVRPPLPPMPRLSEPVSPAPTRVASSQARIEGPGALNSAPEPQ